MNKVFEIGNLAKDPELVPTNSGKQVCRFSIAVNRSYSSSNGEKKTDFFNCIAWAGTAENIARYCTKGSKIAISGSLETNSYTDKNGNKRNEVVIVVGETEFLQTKPSGGSKPQLEEDTSPEADYPF